MSGVDQFLLPRPGHGGLVIVGTSTGDFHVQSTPQALHRQQQFRVLRERWLRGDRPKSAGGRLILSLALHDAVLDAKHVAAISRSGDVWTDGTAVALEWRLPRGWRDRRFLSQHSAQCVRDHGGITLTSSHWSDAAAYLRKGASVEEPVIAKLFETVTAGWYFDLPGQLFLHCLRLAPLQPLDRTAHARRASGQPLLAEPAGPITERRLAIDVGLQMARRPSPRLECAHRIKQMFRRSVLKAGEQAIRKKWEIDLVTLFEEARGHGRAQALVVAGTLHVVEEGGISGELLRPSTLVSYVGDTVERLLKAMLAHGGDPDDFTADTWHTIYSETIAQVHASVQGKAAAFLAAFHRMLVGRGAQPLTGPIGHGIFEQPPAARTLFDAELERAKSFVSHTASTERIARQALLMLMIGKVVAIRTSELFTLRVADVQEGPGGTCILSISPRRADGTGKTPAVRRQVEIHDLALIELLLAMRRQRLAEDAGPSDVLFGEPRRPGERHAEQETTELVQRAIKAATGDAVSSYYCLRHRVLSDQVESALMPGAGVADEPRLLASISGRAGHASIASSRPYVNRFEDALQAWAMLSHQSGVPASTAGFARVEEGIALAQPDMGSASDQWASSGHRRTVLSADQVIDVLNDVACDRGLAATARRNNVSEQQVRDILFGALDVLATLRIGPAVCSAHRLLDAISLVQHQKTWWRASAQPKYDGLRRRLATAIEQEPRLLDRVIRAWQVSYSKEELALDHFEASAPLLDFINGCDVPLGRLLVTCALAGVPGHLQTRVRRGLVVHRVPPRAGRARTRLHISSMDATTQVPSGPAIAVQGLHAWMVAAAICQASREAA